MDVESINEVSGLVAAAAAAATVEAEAIVQPLFADTIEPVAPEENTSSADDDTSSADDDTSSTTSSVEQGLNSAPTEMRQWMDEIDNIEYHYRHDDDDRGYNFFRDNAGNTLMIQEFDLKGERYFNINREIIMKHSDFISLYDAVKTPEGVNATIFGQKLFKNCSTDLLVEALTIFADDTSSDEDEDDTSSEPEAEAKSSPIPTGGDQASVQRFLLSLFLGLMVLRTIGLIGSML